MFEMNMEIQIDYSQKVTHRDWVLCDVNLKTNTSKEVSRTHMVETWNRFLKASEQTFISSNHNKTAYYSILPDGTRSAEYYYVQAGVYELYAFKNNGQPISKAVYYKDGRHEFYQYSNGKYKLVNTKSELFIRMMPSEIQVIVSKVGSVICLPCWQNQNKKSTIARKLVKNNIYNNKIVMDI